MRGWIVLNGNIVLDVDIVYQYADRICESNHVDETVRKWRKVLLITAAWKKDEYKETHVKDALRRIGIPSRFEDGFDQNIQNLAVYHEFNRLRSAEPALYRLYHEKQEVIIKTKEFYRKKNGDFLKILREQTAYVKEVYPDATMAGILAYDVAGRQGDLPRFTERELLYHYYCQDIQDTLHAIVDNDEKMVRLCREIERYFRARSRVDEHPLFIRIRDELTKRIMSANSIFIFGGHVGVLLNRLHFFRLHNVFREALHRGTNFYAVSAGSVVLSEKLILFDDFWGDDETRSRKEFEFFDNGLGLVDKITVFPHCRDRIQTDDPDNLAYLAHRFSSGPCVGLNEESFLLVEPYLDEQTGRTRDRFVSSGKGDGVYVFDRSGRKIRRDMGEQIDV